MADGLAAAATLVPSSYCLEAQTTTTEILHGTFHSYDGLSESSYLQTDTAGTNMAHVIIILVIPSPVKTATVATAAQCYSCDDESESNHS